MTLSDKADRTALDLLSAMSSGDDLERRAHLTGKRVEKMSRGGAAVPEEGMPRGWVHQRDEYGRRRRVAGKGLAPQGDPKMAPVLQTLYSRFATGATYQELAPLLTEYENQGLLIRRDPANPGNNYQNLTTAVRAHDAIKPFFCIKGTEPAHAPTEDVIAAYEAGEDPAVIFDWETRLYISRLELVRTGVYVRRLANDLPGIRDRGVDGHRPVMKDETDQMGAFYVSSERWPWPVDDDGTELSRSGLTTACCEAAPPGCSASSPAHANSEAAGDARTDSAGFCRTSDHGPLRSASPEASTTTSPPPGECGHAPRTVGRTRSASCIGPPP